MRIFSSLLEILGLAAFVVGLTLLDWRAGLAALGVVGILIGLALDPPGSPQRQVELPGRYDE